MAIDYKSAGVDVERGYEAVRLMKNYVKNLHRRRAGRFGLLRRFLRS